MFKKVQGIYNVAKTVSSPITHLKNIVSSAIGKKGKVSPTIVGVEPAKNLTKLRKIKDEGFKSVDDQTKGTNVTNQKKSEIKKSFGKKVSNIINPVKKAKGGRVEYKRGTGLIPKKKSNVDKIKKTFGTLSVRAGIDNNPNPTYADKIAGAKMKNKKKNKKKLI